MLSYSETLIISSYTFTLDQTVKHSFVLLSPITVLSPNKIVLSYTRAAIFLSQWAKVLFSWRVSIITIIIDPLLPKQVDKWAFVNFVAGDIYSVTKQLLELAPWTCFPIQLSDQLSAH